MTVTIRAENFDVFQTYVFFNLGSFQVLCLSGILLAQERTESDQVVLNENILLSELFFSDSASFLFSILIK